MLKERCPVDGLAYSEHPPSVPPSGPYVSARQHFLEALAHVIYLPHLSPTHRRAILRARRERLGVIR